jgi:hypothetical protein
LATLFLKDSLGRWVAYLLAIFGSGLGWLLFVMNQPNWLGETPVDFKMPEAHIFFTALTFPHVAIGVALVLLSFRFYLRALDRKNNVWLDASLAGSANLALAIVYPFMIYPVFLACLLFLLYRIIISRRMLAREAIVLATCFIIPAPLLLYYALTLATNQFSAPGAQSQFVAATTCCLRLMVQSFCHPHAGHTELVFVVLVIAVALLAYAPLTRRAICRGCPCPAGDSCERRFGLLRARMA